MGEAAHVTRQVGARHGDLAARAFDDSQTQAAVERYIHSIRADAPNAEGGTNIDYVVQYNGMRDRDELYETVLATSLKAETFGAHELRVFAHDDDAASGCLMKGPGLEPSKSGAVVFLNADPSLDAVLGRIERAGGRIAVPRTDLPGDMGSFAHIIDSEGNRVGLHALG